MLAPESRSAQLAGWERLYLKQAEAGELKWSDYYKGLYAHFYFIPELPGYDLYLRWSIAQLEAALATEKGKISQEDFVSFQRQMNVAMRAFMRRHSAYGSRSRCFSARNSSNDGSGRHKAYWDFRSDAG